MDESHDITAISISMSAVKKHTITMDESHDITAISISMSAVKKHNYHG